MDENQLVNVTAYYAEPAKIFIVPDHYSLDDIQEAIQSEMSAGCDLSIAEGEFSPRYYLPRP